jgi:glycosyltransferase involved in cell wall biosynthesis
MSTRRRMSELRPRLISPAGLGGPTGGTRYNERVASEWGIEVEYLPGGWPTPSQRDLDALSRLLHRPGPPRPVMLDGLIASAAEPVLADSRRMRVVALVHLPLPAESGLSPRRRAELGAGEQAALHAADAVACTSSWAAADLRRRYALADAVVAEPGTDAAPLALGSRPPRLLTLAAYLPRKNHRLLLEALADARLASLAWSALWLGAEPVRGARRHLLGTVRDIGLGGRVEVGPARRGPALDQAWAAGDLLLLPSLAESFGMVVTEALARGIPAVVGAGTAAEDTLRHAGSTVEDEQRPPGVALDPRDPAAWTEAVHAWLTDEALRGRWRRLARQRRTGLPGWGATAQRLGDLLSGAVTR